MAASPSMSKEAGKVGARSFARVEEAAALGDGTLSAVRAGSVSTALLPDHERDGIPPAARLQNPQPVLMKDPRRPGVAAGQTAMGGENPPPGLCPAEVLDSSISWFRIS